MYVLISFDLTKYYRCQRTKKRRHDCRSNDRGRINAAVLLPVYDHIHRYELQGRYI